MELLKKRDFGLVMNDTFLFFKEHGKSFFKHYFTINGVFIMVLVTLIFFTFKYYLEALFSSIGNSTSNNFDAYVNNNPALFISIGFIFIILIAILSLFSMSMPILFLKNVAHKKSETLTTKEVWNQLMQIKNQFLIVAIVYLQAHGLLMKLLTH
jgi:hypothetical protein